MILFDGEKIAKMASQPASAKKGNRYETHNSTCTLYNELHDTDNDVAAAC
jgi:hypothetical protein